MPGIPIVFCGPSGVGKSTLADEILRRLPDFGRLITVTTRAPRVGETDGRDYHFVTPEEFDRRLSVGEFLESVDYCGQRYGTWRPALEDQLQRHRAVLCVLELHGALILKQVMPATRLVFIDTADADLRGRLERRPGFTAETVAVRMAAVAEKRQLFQANEELFSLHIDNRDGDLANTVDLLEIFVRVTAFVK